MSCLALAALQLLLLSPRFVSGDRECPTGRLTRQVGFDVTPGVSLAVVRGVTSALQCSQECAKADTRSPSAPHGCLSSAYMPGIKSCYLKAGSADQAVRSQYRDIVLVSCLKRSVQCQAFKQSFGGLHNFKQPFAADSAATCMAACVDDPGCNGAQIQYLVWSSQSQYGPGGSLLEVRPRAPNCQLKALPPGAELLLAEQGTGEWTPGPELREYFVENQQSEGFPTTSGTYTDTLLTETGGYGCDCGILQPGFASYSIIDCPGGLHLVCRNARCECEDSFYWNSELGQCLNPTKQRAVNHDFFGQFDMLGGERRAATSGLCAQTCGTTPGCTAAAWVAGRPWGPNCYLKRVPPGRSAPKPQPGIDILFVNGYNVNAGSNAITAAECEKDSQCGALGGVCSAGSCRCPAVTVALVPFRDDGRQSDDRPGRLDTTRGVCAECVNWKNCKAGEECTTRSWSYQWDIWPPSTRPLGLCVEGSGIIFWGYPPYNYENPDFLF